MSPDPPTSPSPDGSFWSPPSAGAAGPNLDLAIRQIGGSGFGEQVLVDLFPTLGARHLAIMSKQAGEEPHLITWGSITDAAVGLECWRSYRAGLYRYDSTWDSVGQHLKGSPSVVCRHVTADDLPASAYRTVVFTDHALRARLSVYGYAASGEIVACNLYRTNEDGDFREADLRTWDRVGPTLLAASIRHAELSSVSANYGGRVQSALTDKLFDLFPSLSSRETDVCAQVLMGRSYKAIALSMSISPATVKTYRERAFQRIGVESREALLERVFGS